MRDKKSKPQFNAEFKTLKSEQSCIDIFSKVQSLFLQKFFRYNISDYFNEHFCNVEEELFLKKFKNKTIKQLSNVTFLTKTNTSVSQFEKQVNEFYTSRSKCIQNGEIPYTFKHLYSSGESAGYGIIEQGQLVIIQVKIKAEIQKVENIPAVFFKDLSECQMQNLSSSQADQQQLISKLKKYNKNVINLFVVYFGDIHFQFFNQSHYRQRRIIFFNREVEVKIHVFFVSRLAMIDTFKKINKIQNLEYINDILIQLYEFRRQKTKNKRNKSNRLKRINAKPPLIDQRLRIYTFLKWATIFSVGAVSLGAIILKFFF